MVLISSTAGVEQNKPHLTPGHEKVDFSVATIKSQANANWNPAAAAIPFILHNVGTGKFLTFRTNSAHD